MRSGHRAQHTIRDRRCSTVHAVRILVTGAGVPQANGTIEREPTIDAADVARAVVYMATLPLVANVQFMTVMATKMPFIGRG